jgi:hypothetical protein
VSAREDGLTDRLSLSLANACNPLLQAHQPWAQDNTKPWFSPPCIPSRADPSGLGHTATIYSSVQGPPQGRNADRSVLLHSFSNSLKSNGQEHLDHPLILPQHTPPHAHGRQFDIDEAIIFIFCGVLIPLSFSFPLPQSSFPFPRASHA